MEYLLARWYAVKNLPPQRLKALHNFEIAVKMYSAQKAAELKKQKIFLPLWWQEGALFLNKEFKTFWQLKAANLSEIQKFKAETEKIFKQNKLLVEDGRIFDDIQFMHSCDLAVNSSARNAGPSSVNPA